MRLGYGPGRGAGRGLGDGLGLEDGLGVGDGLGPQVPVLVSHAPVVQVPHELPQPSSPHSFPAQFGTQVHASLTHVSFAAQILPHSPQLLLSVDKFTHELAHTTFPLGQQRPKRARPLLKMGFAQFRSQQLMSVAHTRLSGLQPSARTSRGQSNVAITARKTREQNSDRTRHIRPPSAGMSRRPT
jgi:hypothetical protein